MSQYPTVKAKEFIKVIEKLGFYFDRQKGSHTVYKNNDGRRVVIPIHLGKDLKQGTLMGMIRHLQDLKAFARRLFVLHRQIGSTAKMLISRS